jgi:creatinine amidohydrolase
MRCLSLTRRFRISVLLVLGLTGTWILWGGPTVRAAGPRTGKVVKNATRPPTPGIYFYDQLTSIDAARVDRDSTIILQPVGMIHPHGPHLPSGTDNFIVEALVRRTAEKIRQQRPEMGVLVMPLLPLGTGPANELGYIYNLPGAAAMSRRVLEASLVDWSLNFATNSWRNFFLVSFHHDPSDYKVLTDVSEFLHEAYGMASANVTSLVLADSLFLEQVRRLKGAPKDTVAFALGLHGGAAETSLLLAVAPDRVESSFRTLPPLPVASWEDLTKAAQRLGWLYYFGNPAAASAEYGAGLLDLLAESHARMILSTVADSSFPHGRPYFEDALKKEFVLREVVRSSEAYEVKSHQKYVTWLKHRQENQGAPATSPPGPRR